VGIVLQAYLKRTLADIADLRDLAPSVRLCKGIYIEPASIAFQDHEVVRRSFVSCLEALLEGGSRVAIATHDEMLIGESLSRVAALGHDAYEFQMLLGVRESRADELVAAGHPLRVYVPFGQRWYEYSLRRLQENPQMAGVIARATVARAIGRS
jgi:proline dehydrogenase